jgi:hypothetical protein
MGEGQGGLAAPPSLAFADKHLLRPLAGQQVGVRPSTYWQ